MVKFLKFFVFIPLIGLLSTSFNTNNINRYANINESSEKIHNKLLFYRNENLKKKVADIVIKEYKIDSIFRNLAYSNKLCLD
jgi:hypothetical protein